MNLDEIIKKQKEHLTQAQIKALAQAAERYKQVSAARRAEAYSSLHKGLSSTRRALQNMGLASRQGKLISGMESSARATAERTYSDYNQQLNKVSDAYTRQAAARMARENQIQQHLEDLKKQQEEINAQIEQYKKEAAKANAAQQVQNAVQQAAAAAQAAAARQAAQNRQTYANARNGLWNTAMTDTGTGGTPRTSLADRVQNAVKQASNGVANVTQKVTNSTPKGAIQNAAQKAVEAYYAPAIQMLQNRAQRKMPEWDAAIASGNSSAFEKTRKEMGEVLAQIQRMRFASYVPQNVGKLIVLSDDDFNTRYDAALKLYNQKVKEAERQRSMQDPWDHDTSYVDALINQANTEFSVWDQAKKLRDDPKNGLSADSAFYGTVQYDADAAKYKSNEKNLTGSGIRPRYKDDDWKAYTYDEQHGTEKSKYAAIVNEYSLMIPNAAFNYSFAGTIRDVGDWFQQWTHVFDGDATEKMKFNRFMQKIGMEKGEMIAGNVGNNARKEIVESVVAAAHYMTEGERETFNTILSKYGEAKADEYFEFLRPTLTNRLMTGVTEENEFYTRDGIGKVRASLESIPVNLAQGVTNPLRTILTGQDDPYAARLEAMRSNSAGQIREAVQKDMGSAGRFIYGTLMSMADSATVGVISGGLGNLFEGIGLPAQFAGKAGSVLGGSILGGSAFNSAYQEALDRGLSPDMARVTAFGQGVNEMLFESLSLDLLIDQFKKGGILKVSEKAWKNWIVNTLVQGGVEGSEEVFTDLANRLWDNKVNGVLSEEMQQIFAYMQNGMGYDEAKEAVSKEFAEQLGMSFLGGFVSGGVMGGAAGAMHNVQMRDYERIGNNMDAATKAELDTFKFKDEQMQELQKQSNKTNQDYGVLLQGYLAEMYGKFDGNIQQAVKDGVITKEDAALLEKWQKDGVQTVDKDGKVVGNEQGITKEQLQTVNETLSKLDIEPLMKIAQAQESIRFNQQVGVKNAETLRTFEAKQNEAQKQYDEEVVKIEADETLTDAQKEQKKAEAYQRMTDAQGKATEELSAKVGKKVDIKVEKDGMTVKTKKGSGSVTFDFSTRVDGKTENHNTVESMTEREKAALRIAQVVAALNGTNIKVESQFTSRKLADGTVEDLSKKNGYYDPETDTIHVNLNGTNSVLWTISHELTHRLATMNKQGYTELHDAIKSELTKENLTYSEVQTLEHSYQIDKLQEYLNKGMNLWDALVAYEESRGYKGADAEEEVIARCCEQFLAKSTFINSFASKHYKTAKSISAFLTRMNADMQQLFADVNTRSTLAATTRNAQGYYETWNTDVSPEQDILNQMNALDDIARKWENAVKKVDQKRKAKETAKAENVKASTMEKDAHFEVHKYYDRIVQKIEDQNESGYTKVGEIKQGSIYEKIGMPVGSTYFDNGKILKEIHKVGDPLPIKYLRMVPEILANPTVITEANKPNTINVFGEIRRETGKPLLVGIVAVRDRTGKSVITKVRTTHQRFSDLAKIINDESVLYITEDKKRAKAWFQASRIDMPSGGTKFGFIRRITLSDDIVKLSDNKMQKKFSTQDIETSDKQYMSLAQKVKDGTATDADKAELRKQVDAAARAAGYQVRAYHGTPNGTFNKFREWQYFTTNKEYADVYQGQSASSLSYKKTALNKKTYDTFLKMERPFDTRTARDRKIFNNEFYQKWGNGSQLTDRGLPDWVEGLDLIEFFEDKGYNYDSIILDEGGTGGYGEDVIDRGISYVIKNPSQIKSADLVTYDSDGNIIPLSERFKIDRTGEEAWKNEDIRYSMQDIETTASLTDKEYEAKRDRYIEQIRLLERERNEAQAIMDEIEESDEYKDAFDRLLNAPRSEFKKQLSEFQKVLEQNSEYENAKRKTDTLDKQLKKLRDEADQLDYDKQEFDYQQGMKESGLSEAEYSRKQAVREFGYTPYFYDAGYLLPNGKMLNFSGEKGRHYGTRGQDHRAIGTIYPHSQGSEAMIRFMNDGNIRVMAETPGIDLCSAVEPTKEQYAAIRRFAEESRRKEYFSVDLSDKNGDNVGTLEYDGNVNPTRIINDIKHFYETGEVRKQSSVSQFHYSTQDKDFHLTQRIGEQRVYEMRGTTANVYGSSVELEGGTLLNKVRMMQNLAEMYGSVTVTATSEKEAQAFERAGAKRETDTFGDTEYGTWAFEHKEDQYREDTLYDAKQKRNFANAVLKEVGTYRNFTKEDLRIIRARLEKAFAILHNAWHGQGDQLVAMEYADKLFDAILNRYTEMSEADAEMRDAILAEIPSRRDAKGHIIHDIEVTAAQMAEIKHVYGSVAAYNQALTKALGTRVYVKEAQNAQTLEDVFANNPYLDATTNEGDMPTVLLERAQETVGKRTNPYKAESEERAANKDAMMSTALGIVGIEKSSAQKVREAVKQARAEERAKAKTKTQTEVEKARLAERMHEGAIRAKERRASAERETNIKREAARREAKLKDVTQRKLAEQKVELLRRDVKSVALKWNQRLVKMLANPTEASHIPVQLAREVAEFTDALTRFLDSGTERGQINLAKIAKAYQQAFDDQATIAQAKAENPKYDPRGQVIDKEMFDQQLVDMMDELNTILQGKSLKDLNPFEMRMLLNTVRGVAHTVYEANRMIGTTERKAIWQVGDKMVSELENAPKVSDKLRAYLESALDLRRLAKIFSGSNENAEFVKLVEQLNKGAIEKERIAQTLQSIFKPVTDRYGDDIRKWYGKNAEWIDTGITKNGKKVEITKGMRVSLALHVLNEGNMRHIENGGLTIPNREMYRKGKLTDAYANGDLVRLNAEQINEIISHMTDAEKAYVEAAKELFHKRTGYFINKTSLALLGYRKAMVENYFPIHTDKNFTKTDFASLKQDGSIEGQGFLKERVNASNPVYLEDITSVVNRQIRGVALYAGLAIPMRNFNAVMNASIYEDDNGVWSPRTTVKQTLTQKMGDYGRKVVEGFLSDVSEMSHVDVTPMERFAGKLAANYVKAVLLGNMKVALKQVASYPTAAAVIPWKYLGKALLAGGKNHRLISRADVDLINQYTPLYQMRRDGQANEIASIMQKRGLEDKLPWLLKWITKMDVMTVGRLWSAAEYMVADQQKNLPVGSDAYYQAVAQVFNDTVQQTQPNFTPLQRNAALRSKNPIVRSLVLFGTQRMQNGGILMEAAYELKQSKGKSKAEIQAAKQKLGRAVASQVVQNILLIVASLGVDALRGRMKGWQDEDKDITAESLAKGMGDMFLSNAIGSFLGGSEVYNLVSTLYKKSVGDTTYDSEFTVPALDAAETIINTVGKLPDVFKYLTGDHTLDEKLNKMKTFGFDLAKAAGYATGIPLENALKDLFKGIIPAIKDHADWYKTGEFPKWWLHQSGKLDAKKTSERYTEWVNLGKSGREFLYIDNKLKGVTSRDGRIDVLAGEDIPAEDKARIMVMYDNNGAFCAGSQVFNAKGKLIVDFANVEPPSPIETTLDEIAEASAMPTAEPTAEPTATPNPLSKAKQEGVQQAVAQGVPEQTANDAFITYQNIGQVEGRDEEFREWLFKNVSDPHQRAVLDYQVIGRAAKVEGAVTYKDNGTVYRDYTNANWYKLSNRKASSDGTNKRYDAAKKLEQTGLTVDKTVAIYDKLDELTKKAEWTEYLKAQGLTDEQIHLFLWSRGWYKRK